MKVRISLIAITCAAVTAVLGVGSAHAAVVKSYCIDGATETVSNGTALGLMQQFELDAFAVLGGAYTLVSPLAITPPADGSLLTALGNLSVITSPFPMPGAVFHPVVAGACPVAPVVTPPVADDTAAAASVAAPLPPPEEGIFLCYSKWQVDPGVWPAAEAQWLLWSGQYWQPTAVAGAQSSTQLGGYSLVCNPGKTTASASAASLDGSGAITTSPDLQGRLDVYPVG